MRNREVQERASWGVDLCPEKGIIQNQVISHFLKINSHTFVLQNDVNEAFHTPVKEPKKLALDLTYSMKKSPIKSRAAKVFSDPGGVHSTTPDHL